jgi:hypothetical protein
MYFAKVAVEQPKKAQASSYVQSQLPSARNAVGVIGAVFFRGGRIHGGANGRPLLSFEIGNLRAFGFRARWYERLARWAFSVAAMIADEFSCFSMRLTSIS